MDDTELRKRLRDFTEYITQPGAVDLRPMWWVADQILEMMRQTESLTCTAEWVSAKGYGVDKCDKPAKYRHPEHNAHGEVTLCEWHERAHRQECTAAHCRPGVPL